MKVCSSTHDWLLFSAHDNVMLYFVNTSSSRNSGNLHRRKVSDQLIARRFPRHNHNTLSFLYHTKLLRILDRSRRTLHFRHIRELIVNVNRVNTSMHHELSRNFGVWAECQYWDVGSVCRNHAGQTTLRRQHNNHGSISFFRCNYGRLCNGSIDALIRAVCLPLHKSIPRRKIRTGHGMFGEMFSAGNNLIHRLHDLNRIFALGGFS
mmetsp:Transcript_8288/g.12484  ORF Transcript_8288/g.12484 Transcript_8288/m.12484 type:complete len:207 (+) Transcript_8288:65-685(+)